MTEEEFLLTELQKMYSEINKRHACQFMRYYEALVEKNKVMNLTAITEFEEVVTKHFTDSLSLCRLGKPIGDARILDVGTGAGFPGIPLKIVYPNMKLTLLDSLNKRIVFLQEVVAMLELEDVSCIHGRAEDIAHNAEHREKYDFVVSRAVSNLATLSEYCLPFVKKNGYFVAYKSEKTEEEIKQAERAIKMLGGKLETIDSFTLPGTDYTRTLVVIKKESSTAGKYPRKAGLPAKEPL